MSGSSKAIWKFPISLTDAIEVPMPEGAQVLSVVKDPSIVNQLNIYAVVDRNAPMKNRTFLVYGTGHPLHRNHAIHRFIGTVIDGAFVWHVYEGWQG